MSESLEFRSLVYHIDSISVVDTPFNPFVPNVPFLYPLKTLENLKVFWYFQGAEKGYIGNEWVKEPNFYGNHKYNYDTFRNYI